MKNANKVDPEVETEIAGELVTVNCGYGTAIRFEKATGVPLSALTNSNTMSSLTTIVSFLHSALYRKDKKFTKQYIEDNLDKPLIKHCINTVIPAAINNAYDFTELEDEDSEDSDDESGDGKKKTDSL